VAFQIYAVGGSWTSVLNSPYATLNLNGFEIPLTVIGCLAYGIVALLSFQPLIADAAENDDERNNRMVILGITTSMATFSSFLISILFDVLHESCHICHFIQLDGIFGLVYRVFAT
jgi:uncharacterized membrane protein